MHARTVPWHFAKDTDSIYKTFLNKRHQEGYGFHPFDLINENAKKILYLVLDPDPLIRPTVDGLLENEWISSIQSCHYENENGMDKGGEMYKSGEIHALNQVSHTHVAMCDV